MMIAASSCWNNLEVELCFSLTLSSLGISSSTGCVTVASELLIEAESSSARTELNSSPQRYDLTTLHLLLSPALLLPWIDPSFVNELEIGKRDYQSHN